jgi:uncharacterized DUF497 family protein
MALIFEWDPTKAKSNASKHGIAFDVACVAFYDPDNIADPHRVQGGEDRFRIIGLAKGRLLFVEYTWRGQNIRLISARKAIGNESIRYWKRRHIYARP